jgi:hypothetical protein
MRMLAALVLLLSGCDDGSGICQAGCLCFKTESSCAQIGCHWIEPAMVCSNGEQDAGAD